MFVILEDPKCAIEFAPQTWVKTDTLGKEIVYWPKHLYRKDAWCTVPDKVKRRDIPTLEAAKKILDDMVNSTPTESECDEDMANQGMLTRGKSRNSGGKSKQTKSESVPTYNVTSVMSKLPLKSTIQGKVFIDSPNSSPKTPTNSRSATPNVMLQNPSTPLSSKSKSTFIRNNMMTMSPSDILSPLTRHINAVDASDTVIGQMCSNGRVTAVTGITTLPKQTSTLPQASSSADQNAIQTNENMTTSNIADSAGDMMIIQQSDGVSLFCLVLFGFYLYFLYFVLII